MDNELVAIETTLQEFSKVDAGLAVLRDAYQGVVYQVQTKEGMEAAKHARRALREPRFKVETLRKEAKRPLLDLGKRLDAEAKRIEAAIMELEQPIVEQINHEEERVIREAAEKLAAETRRVERLEARLDTIRLMPYDANGLDSKTVQAVLDEAKALPIGDDWEEFKEKAAAAKIATVAALEGVLAKAQAAEAEAARIVAERAELERLRAEQAAREAEARKAQEAENARIALEQKAEREKLAAEKAELDRIERERQAAAKAEQDRLDAERRAFEQERAAAEEAARPKPEPVKVKAKGKRPSDAEIVQCVCERFGVEIATAEEWLADFANRNLAGRAA